MNFCHLSSCASWTSFFCQWQKQGLKVWHSFGGWDEIQGDLSRLPSPSLQSIFTLVNKFLTERDREKGKRYFFCVVKIGCMIVMTGDPISAMRRDETSRRWQKHQVTQLTNSTNPWWTSYCMGKEFLLLRPFRITFAITFSPKILLERRKVRSIN